MNFLRNTGKSADYIVTGTWSKKAADEAKTQGTVRAAWDGKAGNYNRVPPQGELKLDPNAAYVYIDLERDDPGRAVPGRARGGRRAAGLRRLVRFPLPAGADRPLRHPLRLCAEERRAGGRDHRHHPRRPGGRARPPTCPRCSTTASWPRTSRC